MSDILEGEGEQTEDGDQERERDEVAVINAHGDAGADGAGTGAREEGKSVDLMSSIASEAPRTRFEIIHVTIPERICAEAVAE